ncbi:MAG: hypothetical protein E3K29_06885 [Candidatus Brocadia sp.]|nr:hypothetical protein [Candidatus Brocadia sp.]
MEEKPDLIAKDGQELKRLKEHREFDEFVGYLKATNDFKTVIHKSGKRTLSQSLCHTHHALHLQHLACL